ncbi:MAG: hypothetical protein JWO30_3663 [Fibrobacteres bacterium]|nr:hypothetical protein [Fibrobacterota bacterium]
MKAIAFLIAVSLGSHLAWGDAVKAPAKNTRPKPKVVDLDFSDDEESNGKSSQSIVPSSGVHPWIYWTLGATVAAAAGGVGFYLYQDRTKTPTVTRNEQVFTDDRP